MRSARWRLASLWLSQSARALADNCVRMFLVLRLAGGAVQPVKDGAWHQVTAFFILPFILLAPINGAISNGLPRRWVLVWSAACSLLLTGVLGVLVTQWDNSWLWCAGLALVMAGQAVYSPTRYALLPAVAEDAHVPLSRINGWIEMGGSAAIVAGFLLGAELHDVSWGGLPTAIALALFLDLVAVLAAWPSCFPADVRRPEPPGRAIAGFFKDTVRVFGDAQARFTLLGLASFLALVVTGSGAIFAFVRAADSTAGQMLFVEALLFVGIGAAGGSLLASLQGNLGRALGLVPWAATGLLASLAWAAFGPDPRWPALALGVMGGLINVPLRAAYQEAVPADARGNGMAVMNTTYYVLLTALAMGVFGLVRLNLLGAAGQLAFLALLAAIGTILTWWALFRECLELLVEIMLWPAYRIHAHGRGLEHFPHRGPVLVIGNHSAWFDPLWVAKVLPRRLTPMMTSVFYDLPVLRWLMVHIVHAIRVPYSTYRHEAPELKEATAALDRGEVVLIFPEGWMRRRDNQFLRLFGQGVWHILNERPLTPVVTCWIEGGWGSYMSYKNGSPTKNKRMDWWRRIEIAVSEPRVLDPALLADQRATREFLMKAVLNMRAELGLEPALPPSAVTFPDEEEHEDPLSHGS